MTLDRLIELLEEFRDEYGGDIFVENGGNGQLLTSVDFEVKDMGFPDMPMSVLLVL